jgi:hypothetical protein
MKNSFPFLDANTSVFPCRDVAAFGSLKLDPAMAQIRGRSPGMDFQRLGLMPRRQLPWPQILSSGINGTPGRNCAKMISECSRSGRIASIAPLMSFLRARGGDPDNVTLEVIRAMGG